MFRPTMWSFSVGRTPINNGSVGNQSKPYCPLKREVKMLRKTACLLNVELDDEYFVWSVVFWYLIHGIYI